MRSSAQIIPPPPWPELQNNGVAAQSVFKVYRARQHAHEVSARWEEIVRRHFVEATGGNAGLSYPIHENLFAPQVPVTIPLAIGDCLRNLRSALDYLLSELSRSVGLGDKRTMFPFDEDPEIVRSMFEPVNKQGPRKGRFQGSLKKLTESYPSLRKFVLEDVQPYSAANGADVRGDLLWRVITADNIDKHRLFAPAAQRSKGGQIKINGPIPTTISGLNMTGMGLVLPPGSVLDKGSDFSVDLVFREPTKLAGRPVTNTLNDACEAVAEVVELFRTEFSG